jgi:RNA polymerase sigma-70 factor (ECF subfamily)
MGPSEDELVSRAVAGDESAQNQLFLRNIPRLRQRFAPKIPAWLQSTYSVDDLIQDTLIETFTMLKNGFVARGARGFEAFLKKRAWRTLVTRIRYEQAGKRGGKWNREDLLESLFETATAPGTRLTRQLRQKERAAIVQEALEKLPGTFRIVLELHYLSGWSIEKIASVLKLAPRTVRDRLKRGLRALRREIEKKLGSGDWLS